MIIYLSPAKVLNFSQPSRSPIKICFAEKTEHLFQTAKSLSKTQLQSELVISDKLAERVYSYYQQPQPTFKPLELFSGEAFKALDYGSLSSKHQQKAKERIYIGDAFYGLIKGTHIIAPYRLDFTKPFNEINLYAYWKTTVQSQFDRPIVDLSSMEYHQLLPHYLDHPQVRIDLVKGSSFLRKTFRGRVARAIIEQNIDQLSELNRLSVPGFKFYDQTKSHLYYISED